MSLISEDVKNGQLGIWIVDLWGLVMAMFPIFFFSKINGDYPIVMFDYQGYMFRHTLYIEIREIISKLHVEHVSDP
jgi:hypothetical protein